MKKLVVLAAVAGGVLFVLKRNKAAKAEADLWREATAPGDTSLGSVSANGSAPSQSSKSATNN
ncbi:MAG: DLW-39 family protein [Haloechinothrix sp.]